MKNEDKAFSVFVIAFVCLILFLLYKLATYYPACEGEKPRVYVSCANSNCGVIVDPGHCQFTAVYKDGLTPSEAEALAKDLNEKLGYK